MTKENSKNSTESKRSFKKHWKLAVVLALLVVLLAGAGLWIFLGNRNQETVAGATYTVMVKNADGQPVDEVYVELCNMDGTEINWLPYVTNATGKVEFKDVQQEEVFVRVVGVPVGYALDENVQYKFDESGNVIITLGQDDAIYVAQIGETMFTNFSSALGVANGKNGEIVIELLSDVTLSSYVINNLYEGDIIIDGKGHSITTVEGNNAFDVQSPKGSISFRNVTIVHKNTGSIVQMNSLVTLNMTDVTVDATQGSGYNYTLFNTMATDGTTTINMTRTNITMAAGTAAKANEAGIIRTGNTGGTKNVKISLNSCNLDVSGATGRQCIVVMKNTVADINIKNSTLKAGDSYAVWNTETTKPQGLTTVGSKYVSEKYPKAPIYGYSFQIGNTCYSPLQHALDMASESKTDVTCKLIGDYTMKTGNLHNKNGATVIVDGNGYKLTTKDGGNAFVVGGKVAFQNLDVNHINNGSFVQMKELANVTMTDVNLNATEGKNYNYCLINMLAAGGESTVDCTRVNATMAVESAGADANAAIIRTGNASDSDKKTVKINLTDCNFDTTKATGRSAIVVMSTTTATVNIKNSKLATMDDFVIRSNEQEINWNNADTKLDSLDPAYKEYPVEWYLAKIGDVFYTLKDALEVANAATTDTSIKILANYTIASYEVNNANGKKITIDGNKKTITSSGGNNAFILGNDVTLKNMTIDHKNGGSAVQILKAGTVNLKDIKLNATAGSVYNYALINIMAADDVTNLDLDNVDVTMSVKGAGADGKEGQRTAILRTGNDGGADKKTVNITMKNCEWDATKATGRSGIVVMTNTTADIVLENSTITTLDEAPIRAREDSSLAYTLTLVGENNVLDSSTKEFNKSNEPIRGYDAKIGKVYYHDLKDAVTKANEGDTIELVQNIKVQDVALTKAVTIDGKGKTITTTGGAVFKVQAAAVIELKNMDIQYQGTDVALRMEKQGADVQLTNVKLTSTKNVNWTLVNFLDKGNALTKLTFNKVTIDMDTSAEPKKNPDKAIIRTGNSGDAKKIEINIIDSKLDASDAKDRSVVRIMEGTNATIKVENSTLKTNNVSAIINTGTGQVTVTGTDFVCGKKVADVKGYTLQIGDTWYVGNGLYEALNNATEDMTITLTEDLSLELNKINNVNGKVITIVANGYNLNVTGSSDSVVIVNDAEVTVNGQTLYLSVDDAIATANSATDNVTIKLNIDCELKLTNINNENGKTITIDSNGHTVTGTGTLWDTVTVLGSKATCKVGNRTYFTADFAEALAKANEITGAAIITLYDDITVSDVELRKAITIEGNGHTITTTAGNGFRFYSADEFHLNDIQYAFKSTEVAIRIEKAGADVNLNNVDFAVTGDVAWALFNFNAEGGALSKLTLTDVNVSYQNIPERSVNNRAIIRTGNGNNKVNITINDSVLDASGAKNRNGIAIMSSTEATIAITNSTIKTQNVAPIKDDSAFAIIKKTNYLYDIASTSWDNKVAYIGNTPYATFAEAVTAANGYGKSRIELLDNVEITSPVTFTKQVTIDGNFFTLTTNTSDSHAIRLNYAGTFNFYNMEINHIKTQTFIQVNAIAKVNLTDVIVTAEETGAANYKWAIINTPAKDNTADKPIELTFTRVDLTMETADYGNNKDNSVIRTGNNDETRYINITLNDCDWNLTGAPHRIGINIMNKATATVNLINSTIQTNSADAVNDNSKKATINVQNDANVATMSLEDEAEDTVQLILEVPKSLYKALVKWIKQFAIDNEWDLNL